MSYTTIPAASSGGSITVDPTSIVLSGGTYYTSDSLVLTASYFRGRGRSLASLGRGGEIFDSFTTFTADPTSANPLPTGWTSTNRAGSGAGSYQQGGFWRADTGATGSSADEYRTWAGPLKNTTQAFYFATRFRIATAIDSAAWIMVGLEEKVAGNTIAVGFRGAQSATNFIFLYDLLNSTPYLDTGIGVDTNWHYAEFYCNGSDSKLRAQFDLSGSELVSASAMASPTDQVNRIMRNCRNGATAASRKLDVSWVYLTFPHQ